ncbi:MAG: hypothetical protein NC489_32170 [Ruminococcus flavefaciens]|nr:hypothetical protein [Ruminococcus flavefaciens]
MKTVYNISSEAIETVYTYEEWLKEYNRRKIKRKIRQHTQHLYYMKQCFIGFILAVSGVAAPLILHDGTFSLLALPLGIFLMLTNEKVITF